MIDENIELFIMKDKVKILIVFSVFNYDFKYFLIFKYFWDMIRQQLFFDNIKQGRWKFNKKLILDV